jgi:hypothetical protein
MIQIIMMPVMDNVCVDIAGDSCYATEAKTPLVKDCYESNQKKQ